jgi:uncharacterized membrane protein YoaK (UPF0700 family)
MEFANFLVALIGRLAGTAVGNPLTLIVAIIGSSPRWSRSISFLIALAGGALLGILNVLLLRWADQGPVDGMEIIILTIVATLLETWLFFGLRKVRHKLRPE